MCISYYFLLVNSNVDTKHDDRSGGDKTQHGHTWDDLPCSRSGSAQLSWQWRPDQSLLCWGLTPLLPALGLPPRHLYLSPRWRTPSSQLQLAPELSRGKYTHIQVDKHARLHTHMWAWACTQAHMGGHTWKHSVKTHYTQKHSIL